jgi:hypothetical protein
MKTRKRGYLSAVFVGIVMLATVLSLVLTIHFSREGAYSGLNKLKVTIRINGEREPLTAHAYGIGDEAVMEIIRKVREKSHTPAALIIEGFLFVEHPGTYRFLLRSNGQSTLLLGGQSPAAPPISSGENRPTPGISMKRGLHELTIVYRPNKRRNRLKLLWQCPETNEWQRVPLENLFSPGAAHYPAEAWPEAARRSRNAQFWHHLGHSSLYVCLVGLLLLTILAYKGKFYDLVRSRLPVPGSLNSHRPPPNNRIGEIDAAKGAAGLFMIMAHLDWFHLMPVGTFGAPLFFLCSGMNTVLFVDKTRSARGTGLYQAFFVLLLFFGGYSQIAIMRPGGSPLIPEFLQMSALSILLIFLLSKIIKKSVYIGGLFVVPFLLHLGFKYHVLEFLHTDAPLRTFFFGPHHFPLFPWSGFFLYGVLLLYLRKSIRGLWAAILLNGGAAVLTIFILNIPLTKTNMSLSYMALALLVVTGVFTLFVWLQKHGHRPVIRFIQHNFSLLGRNSLMFLYVHYFTTFYFRFTVPYLPAALNLLLQIAVVFVLTLFLITIYERLREDFSLFLPALFTICLLGILRYGLPLAGARDFRLMDIMIGLLFAFLYVQLRRILRPFLQKS